MIFYIYTGIYEAKFIEPFVAASFISDMKDDKLKDWQAKYGKSVNASLREFILEYVGKPINDMLRYCFVSVHYNVFLYSLFFCFKKNHTFYIFFIFRHIKNSELLLLLLLLFIIVYYCLLLFIITIIVIK